MVSSQPQLPLLLPLLLLLLQLLAAVQCRDVGRVPSDSAEEGKSSRSCAASRRSNVQEALDELFTCLVSSRVSGSWISNVANGIDFRGRAGSGQTQAPLLRGLYSTGRLIRETASYGQFAAVAEIFDPVLGRNETRGQRELAQLELYYRHLEASPYIVDLFATLLANGFAGAARSVRDFVRGAMYDQWFRLYGRRRRHHLNGLRESSGFGHVMVGELRSGSVTGFHSWLRLLAAEEAGEFAYKGFVRYERQPLVLGLLQFDWRGHSKPASSFLFGVEPDFELALLTASFVVNPGRRTTFSIGGRPLRVQTYRVDHQPASVATAYVVG